MPQPTAAGESPAGDLGKTVRRSMLFEKGSSPLLLEVNKLNSARDAGVQLVQNAAQSSRLSPQRAFLFVNCES